MGVLTNALICLFINPTLWVQELAFHLARLERVISGFAVMIKVCCST
jgi:hypothetical protein